MAVTCQYTSNVTARETLSTGVSSSNGDNTIIHDAINTEKTLDASSTPAVTKMAWMNQALSGGTATIDLTSLTGTNGAAVTLSGLKVQVIKFKNPAGNAAITITFGASNPYLLWGAGFKVILNAEDEHAFFGNDSTPDVAGGAKDIDISGTGSEVLEFQVSAG